MSFVNAINQKVMRMKRSSTTSRKTITKTTTTIATTTTTTTTTTMYYYCCHYYCHYYKRTGNVTTCTQTHNKEYRLMCSDYEGSTHTCKYLLPNCTGDDRNDCLNPLFYYVPIDSFCAQAGRVPVSLRNGVNTLTLLHVKGAIEIHHQGGKIKHKRINVFIYVSHRSHWQLLCFLYSVRVSVSLSWVILY